MYEGNLGINVQLTPTRQKNSRSFSLCFRYCVCIWVSKALLEIMEILFSSYIYKIPAMISICKSFPIIGKDRERLKYSTVHLPKFVKIYKLFIKVQPFLPINEYKEPGQTDRITVFNSVD